VRIRQRFHTCSTGGEDLATNTDRTSITAPLVRNGIKCQLEFQVRSPLVRLKRSVLLFFGDGGKAPPKPPELPIHISRLFATQIVYRPQGSLLTLRPVGQWELTSLFSGRRLNLQPSTFDFHALRFDWIPHSIWGNSKPPTPISGPLASLCSPSSCDSFFFALVGQRVTRKCTQNIKCFSSLQLLREALPCA